ncbi:MAG: hypothetical protein GVY13_04025 [Alphaproteobacteria bacterium]|jgi:hypothetical protein|nr:hypothetical protein [Alphaproteobacteria bacterium]
MAVRIMRLGMSVFCLSIAAAVPATAQRNDPVQLVISEDVCRALVAHQPAAGVEYQPGVDVHGRPVAPADLPGGLDFVAPEDFVVSITRELAGQFGIPEDPGVFEAEAILGTVSFVDGQLFFDGRPLFDPAQALIRRLCRESGAE